MELLDQPFDQWPGLTEVVPTRVGTSYTWSNPHAMVIVTVLNNNRMILRYLNRTFELNYLNRDHRRLFSTLL